MVARWFFDFGRWLCGWRVVETCVEDRVGPFGDIGGRNYERDAAEVPFRGEFADSLEKQTTEKQTMKQNTDRGLITSDGCSSKLMLFALRRLTAYP